MTNKHNNIAPRERILKTAADLFFHQGFRATGINEVIAKAGVAKATFYSHFPTKDNSPSERFLAVMKSVQPWLEANRLRGCAFLNMVAEVPDPCNLLRREGLQHYESLRQLIRDLSEDLINSDAQRYEGLDAQVLADDYMVILGGAIAMTEIYHDIWPAIQGVKLVERLINQR
jgi:AcrR family transcriptional regulator